MVIEHLELERETAGMIMIDSIAFVYPPLQCWIQATCLCVMEVDLVMLVDSGL